MKPNLFVVGAPRCGTTKLHGWLARHPEVFMTRRKEPHFFSTDVNDAFERHQGRSVPWLLRDLDAYLELFAEAGDAKIRGESSVYYLYSETAPRGIREFAPEARIVVCLREPVEFLHSLHGRLRSMGDESRPFAEALELEETRRRGERVPRTARYPGLLFYSEYARFAHHLRRWLALFPHERVRVLLLDDLRSAPAETYRELLAFLGVERLDPPADVPANERVEARSRLLAHALRRRFLGGRWTRVDRVLERLNTRPARPEPVDPELRQRLRRRYRGEVEELGELLGRDLLRLWGYERPSERGASAAPGSGAAV